MWGKRKNKKRKKKSYVGKKKRERERPDSMVRENTFWHTLSIVKMEFEEMSPDLENTQAQILNFL